MTLSVFPTTLPYNHSTKPHYTDITPTGIKVAARSPASSVPWYISAMSLNERLRRFHSAFSCSVFLLFAIGVATASVQKISDNLYAYISQNDSSSNSTFLITTEGILVVDTGLNEQEGRKLLAEIRKISALPIRYIVNTHYHPDHRGGNSVVGPAATVISTTFTFQQSNKEATHTLETEKIVFNKSIEFYLGGNEVRIYFPGPAHTLGDAALYFPQQRALATGDLFLNNSCPAMDEGDMENWIAALDSMLYLPVEHVVPGHFELATKNELQHFRNYLADLRDQVTRMRGKGLSLEQVQKSLVLSDYKDLRQF